MWTATWAHTDATHEMTPSENMLERLAESTVILSGGCKVSSHDEIINIFRNSPKPDRRFRKIWKAAGQMKRKREPNRKMKRKFRRKIKIKAK